MICDYCLEEKDCNEVYKLPNQPETDPPMKACDSCLTELRMEEILCPECYQKWLKNK